MVGLASQSIEFDIARIRTMIRTLEIKYLPKATITLGLFALNASAVSAVNVPATIKVLSLQSLYYCRNKTGNVKKNVSQHDRQEDDEKLSRSSSIAVEERVE